MQLHNRSWKYLISSTFWLHKSWRWCTTSWSWAKRKGLKRNLRPPTRSVNTSIAFWYTQVIWFEILGFTQSAARFMCTQLACLSSPSHSNISSSSKCSRGSCSTHILYWKFSVQKNFENMYEIPCFSTWAADSLRFRLNTKHIKCLEMKTRRSWSPNYGISKNILHSNILRSMWLDLTAHRQNDNIMCFTTQLDSNHPHPCWCNVKELPWFL